jgi:hypothetical protein
MLIGSGLFDTGWYASHYPEATGTGRHPVEHYLRHGAEGYHPGPEFDTSWYLHANDDVRHAGINPLLHYVHVGRAEGRPRRALIGGPDGAPRIEPSDPQPPPPVPPSQPQPPGGRPGTRSQPPGAVAENQVPRTFAFYLPQFHPIAENDWAHGMGFTEWHNVVKAKPLFRNHYQPRMPGELGFYDLRAEEVLRRQIQLAQEHGISGFCFYYYYFGGKRLLYKPLENFIKSDIDAPFMFLWANENWTKRWDGGDQDVIIAQHHSHADDLAFIRDLIPVFQDTRYVKIGGKPILLVYKTHLFPDISATTETWRAEIERHGFPGIFLVMVDDWISDLDHPRQFGFDASYEIPSNLVPEEVLSAEIGELGLDDDFAGRIVDYAKFAKFHLGRPFPSYKRFRTVMLPWDNTPRYGPRAMVHINGQGEAYKLWLLQAVLDTYRRHAPDERLVFIHSWNEWCEGTYLEPDGKLGRWYLEQTRDALSIARDAIERTGVSGDAEAMAEFLKMQDAKDQGAVAIMQAARRQSAYVWRDLLEQRKEAASKREEVDRLRADIEVLREEARHLRAKAGDLYASHSWRVTRPLRAAVDMLRQKR